MDRHCLWLSWMIWRVFCCGRREANPQMQIRTPMTILKSRGHAGPGNGRWRWIVGLVLLLPLLGGWALGLRAQKPQRQFQLSAEADGFWKLIDRDAKLAMVGTGFGFTEGPVWDKAGFVYVSDEEINKIFRLYPDGRKEELVSLGDPDGNTYDREQRLIDCASVLRAIIRLDRDGKYEILAKEFEGKKFNSPNDVVIGPDGTLYFTDPTLDLPAGEKQEIPF